MRETDGYGANQRISDGLNMLTRRTVTLMSANARLRGVWTVGHRSASRTKMSHQQSYSTFNNLSTKSGGVRLLYSLRNQQFPRVY